MTKSGRAINYQQVLSQCKDERVGAAVIDALTQLFERDRQLLEVNAKEEAMAAKIAQYLAPHFPGLHIDVEYDRRGRDKKQVTWRGGRGSVYPDIIVHSRETENNVLVIEIKKDSNREAKTNDLLKLHAYQHELGYTHALFIRLGVKTRAGTVSECEWVATQRAD